MIEQYRLDAEKRLQENLPPLPLTVDRSSQISFGDLVSGRIRAGRLWCRTWVYADGDAVFSPGPFSWKTSTGNDPW